MSEKLPSIVITGASGFIGRFLLDSVKNEFTVFAIARRSRKESNIPFHKNIHWIQCDIADVDTLDYVAKYISNLGGADFVVHLAAFYDFTYEENDEYQRTNVEGTLNILNFAKDVKVTRFIFASSLAACDFSRTNEKITESFPADADFAYARSKKKGEELVNSYSKYFSCSIVRLAAVYSDWCEFVPLYKLLSTWLSQEFDSRILAGKGESALPYIHVYDVVSLFRKIIKNNAIADPLCTYNASPDGAVSHQELFQIATLYFFGRKTEPIFIPKLLIYPGLIFKKLLHCLRMTGSEPFEKFWMIKYIDRKLLIDSSFTRDALNWEPTSRYNITRRLLFILEKIKSHPDEWRIKNEVALNRVSRRNNLIIYEKLTEKKEEFLALILAEMRNEQNKREFDQYLRLDASEFRCYLSTVYHLIMAAVRSGDRSLMIGYIDDIAMRRFAEGFEPALICHTLAIFRKIISQELIKNEEMKSIEQEIYDYIGLSLQLAEDEVEDLYERLVGKMPLEKILESPLLPDCKELQKMIRQLSALHQISPDNERLYEMEP